MREGIISIKEAGGLNTRGQFILMLIKFKLWGPSISVLVSARSCWEQLNAVGGERKPGCNKKLPKEKRRGADV